MSSGGEPEQQPPSYSSLALPCTNHLYSIQPRTSGLSVIALKLQSNARDPRAPPLYISNAAPIQGRLTVELAQALKISEIVITIRGFQRELSGMFRRVKPGRSTHEGDQDFFTHAITVWSSRGSPASTLAAGTHKFPFSQPLPSHVTSPPSRKRPAVTFRLPPTFAPSDCPVFLMYEISAVIRRGFFRRDENIVVPIRYVSRTLASRPADLRALAYEDGSPLWGPHVDPNGWITRTVQLCGQVYGQRPVDVTCNFSVGAPTSFPRGFAIPIFATIRTTDIQTLDLATSANSLTASLDRKYGIDIDTPIPIDHLLDNNIPIARGRFWTVQVPQADPLHARTLQGEILVPAHATPSFSCPSLTLSYAISFAVSVNGLHPVGVKNGAPAAVFPVVIACSPTPGLHPLSYAPPVRQTEEDNVVVPADRRES